MPHPTTPPPVSLNVSLKCFLFFLAHFKVFIFCIWALRHLLSAAGGQGIMPGLFLLCP